MTCAVHVKHIRIDGWDVISAGPGTAREHRPPEGSGVTWIPAPVPGTAAGALRNAGAWKPGDDRDFDGEDWWFRTTFEAPPAAEGEEVTLRLEGIATVADVYLNDEMLLHNDSMFVGREIEVGERLRGSNELVIHCRALDPLLAERRRPRARWRTRIAKEANLRFFRTMLLGRAPGFAPSPAAVGPWRPVTLERRRHLASEDLRISPRLEGDDGLLAIHARLRCLGSYDLESVEVELDGPSGVHRTALKLTKQDGGIDAVGSLTVPGVAQWWPHTHGTPALHRVRLNAAGTGEPLMIDADRVGFRRIAPGARDPHDVERNGIDLHINGVRTFARGAVWTPIDPAGMAPPDADLRRMLVLARDAGMNMLRVPGTGAYESTAFHDLCDELGILVWQDFAFANFDYPVKAEGFRDLVEAEVAQALERIGRRPSTAVLCGNSEIEQQVAMLGLDPELGRGELFGDLLPALIAQSGSDAIYVPSAPCGGDLPFRPYAGIANYYGVGGYRRPLEDARRSRVRFAAECLALSNIPNDSTAEMMADPAWKLGVQRDVGSEWDFEDVRDHYLELLFDIDAIDLRKRDPERYLELSREVSGEVMAEVFGEWRRQDSDCGGGLVLWLRDLIPGAGWGLLDSDGGPKAALAHLRRALAPVAVWTIDEGLGGVAVHMANDRPEPLEALLRVSFYREFSRHVETVEELIVLPAHGGGDRNVEAMLGRFVDASYAYRFGLPQQDLIVASLESADDHELISQSFRFPAGRPLETSSSTDLNLRASSRARGDGVSELVVTSSHLAYGVRVHVPGHEPSDDAFSVEPGGNEESRWFPRMAAKTLPARPSRRST